ncbi:MAG: type II toxin-antitoxin system HicB family antitoxin [Clostridia bacterium]|nr:type II toxin-antitoxin system HicB family antitoxin [Clostridia bacterium]
MKVIYPVCIFQMQDEYMAFVPDLNTNNTYGITLEETIYMAQDLIASYILEDLEDVSKNEIPKQSKIEDINIKEIQDYWEIDDKDVVSSFKTLVVVDLDEFAQKWGNKSIRKNLTIPKWLNTKAEALNINFSQVLQEALMQKISKE